MRVKLKLRPLEEASKLRTMSKANIGFVGVGRMGANMARRLADLGYPVTAVYDHHASLASSLAIELGFPGGSDPAGGDRRG